jgi:hypothetical protein
MLVGLPQKSGAAGPISARMMTGTARFSRQLQLDFNLAADSSNSAEPGTQPRSYSKK